MVILIDYVVATNVSGQSDPSLTDCATPYGLNPATELVANGAVGSIGLNWNAPEGNNGGGNGNDSCEDLGLVTCPDGSCAPSFAECDDNGGGGNNGGIGDTCTDAYGQPGQLDCLLQCIDQATVDSWLGDGLCDDGTWGAYFDCQEFAFDNGDCPNDGGGGDGGGGDGGGLENCEASGGLLSWVGDGYCDSSNNNPDCDYDGGDCCESTCVDSTYECGVVGYDCQDPDAGGDGGGDGGGGDGTVTCDDRVNDFTAYGSECCDTAWDEFGLNRATLWQLWLGLY